MIVSLNGRGPMCGSAALTGVGQGDLAWGWSSKGGHRQTGSRLPPAGNAVVGVDES